MYGSGTAKRQVPAVGVAERLSSKLHPDVNSVNSGTFKEGRLQMESQLSLAISVGHHLGVHMDSKLL